MFNHHNEGKQRDSHNASAHSKNVSFEFLDSGVFLPIATEISKGGNLTQIVSAVKVTVRPLFLEGTQLRVRNQSEFSEKGQKENSRHNPKPRSYLLLVTTGQNHVIANHVFSWQHNAGECRELTNFLQNLL